MLRASVSVSTNTARATFANNAHDCASMRADDDVGVVGTYRALEERCARDVTRGGYPYELLDLRVTSCVDKDADDEKGGIGFAGERGEDGTRLEVRISNAGAGGAGTRTSAGGTTTSTRGGGGGGRGGSHVSRWTMTLHNDLGRSTETTDWVGASRALHVVEKP